MSKAPGHILCDLAISRSYRTAALFEAPLHYKERLLEMLRLRHGSRSSNRKLIFTLMLAGDFRGKSESVFFFFFQDFLHLTPFLILCFTNKNPTVMFQPSWCVDFCLPLIRLNSSFPGFSHRSQKSSKVGFVFQCTHTWFFGSIFLTQPHVCMFGSCHCHFSSWHFAISTC